MLVKEPLDEYPLSAALKLILLQHSAGDQQLRCFVDWLNVVQR